MQMIIILGYVGFATLAVFSVINIIRQINKTKDEN
jgi:hypothetical protein